MQRVTIVAVTLVSLALTSITGYAAAVTQTFHIHHGTESFTAVEPCTGQLGVATITDENLVLHMTVADNGSEHFTGTIEGRVTFVTGAVIYTGHIAEWFGSNDNSSSEADTFTFNLHLTGSDGSVINTHGLNHFNVNSSGQLNTFLQLSCPPGQPLRT